MHCRHLDSQPDWLKSFVYNYTYTGCYGAPYVLRYSFSIQHARKLAKVKNADFIINDEGITAIPTQARLVIRASFVFWSDAARITFVEDNQEPHFYLYGFKTNATTNIGGVATLPHTKTGLLGLNTRIFSMMPRKIIIPLHETGHILGLQHPFESPHLIDTENFNATSFSVMNYDNEVHRTGRHLQVMTPMPADFAAVQFIYGVNSRTRVGDDVYELTDYSYQQLFPTPTPTIASLPWDSGGTDTFSARFTSNYTRLDLRVNHRSINGYTSVIIPNIDIENAVCGTGKCDVGLNLLSNIVDVRHAKRAHIWSDADHSGRDVILGFKPDTDCLILKFKASLPDDWMIKLAKPGKVKLLNETIAYRNGTQIFLSKHDHITLADVTPDQLNETNLKLELKRPNTQISKFTETIFDEEASLRPALDVLFNHFTSSFMRSSSYILGLALLLDLMRLSQTSRSTMRQVMLVIQLLPFIYYLDFRILAIFVLSNFMLPEENVAHVNHMIAASCHEIQGTTPDALTLGTSMLGGFAGSSFGLWAYNKITRNISSNDFEALKFRHTP